MFSTAKCYELLGLTHGCTKAEIKCAYKRCALMHHPDKNGGSKSSEEMFKQINNAYEVLTNTPRHAGYGTKPQPQTQQPRQHPSRGPRGGTARPLYPRGIDLCTERTFLEHAVVILRKWERTDKRKNSEAENLRTLIAKNKEILDLVEKVWFLRQNSQGEAVNWWREQGRVSRMMMQQMDELDRIMREREE